MWTIMATKRVIAKEVAKALAKALSRNSSGVIFISATSSFLGRRGK